MKKNVLYLLFILIFLPTFLSAQERLAQRMRQLKKQVALKALKTELRSWKRPSSGRWYDRLKISGRVEVEAGFETIDFNDPTVEDETNSDVDLATVELVVDARIVDHVDGHVLFKYEDDAQTVDALTAQLAVEF